MKTKDFFLITLAVAIGTLVALAISGMYVKQQLAATTSGNSTVSTILSLFAPSTGTSA